MFSEALPIPDIERICTYTIKFIERIVVQHKWTAETMV